MGVDTIFYPCMTYNFDEKKGKNHYNCAVIAGYPEVIEANTVHFGDIKYIYEYVGPHQRNKFPGKMHEILNRTLGTFTKAEVKKASDLAYKEYAAFTKKVEKQAQVIMEEARKQDKKIVLLAGRPYHVDPEINHGIHKLIAALGFAVITEDSVASLVPKFDVNIRNQWTYHARLFAAAKYVTMQKDVYMVHLVSFGCGLDAITSDETREILETAGMLYTQLKIDEVTNLGAVKIRLRSLLAAIEQKKED